ncbi:hypothetical protein FALBO_1996 [Fusarium albosuccineum]|uniref:Ankyrin repeat protein n=1 Tax=Fusarium albosuccineum TaxID=1237068 RepID=A0A8H4LN08_9HYPO|nr:hypothetical protein FALBO_1996 [Fusarium albosuccineum]
MSGLEILGAIASSIALAQAVNGTIKAVNLLREIREIQKQCDGLKREVGSLMWFSLGQMANVEQVVTINGFIQDAKRQTSQPSHSPETPPQEHPSVTLATRELEEILQELNRVVAKYQHPRKWHDPKRITNKIQWAFEAKKIEELQRQAQTTKANLHTAVTFRVSSMVERIDVRQEVLLHSVTQHVISHVLATQGKPQNSPKLLESSHLGPIRTSEPSLEQHVPGSDSSGASTTETLEVTEVRRLSVTGDRNRGTTRIKEESLVKVTTIQPLGSRRCGTDCQCRCHWSRQYNSGAWMRPLLGSWLVKYKAAEGSCRMKCGTNAGVELEYQLPRWLWTGVLAFQACQGPSMTCSLRPSRTIPYGDDVWALVKFPSALRNEIKEGLVLFPNDSDPEGESLMEHAILFDCYESIEIMLELWNNLLPQQGLPSNVIYRISRNFEDSPELKDDEPVNSLLAKARSFAERNHVVGQTKVHKAVLEGAGILEALKEQPWATDEFDDLGWAPIHSAIWIDNASALEQLIAAGADINQRDWRGETPLILAASFGRVEMVRLLLEYKECRRQINQGDIVGWTALHAAVEMASPECVCMLLEAGASAEKRDTNGQVPLHVLAGSKSDQQTAREIIRLLQDRHAHLNARDKEGETPEFNAVACNRLSVLRALVDAGASLSTISNRSQNILHVATCDTNVDTLSYLANQNLTDVDPKLKDMNNRTSLDLLAWCSEATDFDLINYGRRPSSEEQKAFRSLYFGLLFHQLLRHMTTLQRLLLAVEHEDASTSSQHIATLINKSDAGNRPDEVRWYRSIGGYIKDDRWDLVMDIVQEEYDETFEELGQVRTRMNGEAEDSDSSNASSDESFSDYYDEESDDYSDALSERAFTDSYEEDSEDTSSWERESCGF